MKVDKNQLSSIPIVWWQAETKLPSHLAAVEVSPLANRGGWWARVGLLVLHGEYSKKSAKSLRAVKQVPTGSLRLKLREYHV